MADARTRFQGLVPSVFGASQYTATLRMLTLRAGSLPLGVRPQEFRELRFGGFSRHELLYVHV